MNIRGTFGCGRCRRTVTVGYDLILPTSASSLSPSSIVGFPASIGFSDCMRAVCHSGILGKSRSCDWIQRLVQLKLRVTQTYYGSDFAGWGGDFDLGADHGCELSLVYRYKVAISIKWTQ